MNHYENFNIYDIDKLETYDAPILVENDFKYFDQNLFSLTDIGNDKYEKLDELSERFFMANIYKK